MEGDPAPLGDLGRGHRDEAIAYARASGRDVDEQELKRFADAPTHWLRHIYAKGLAEALQHGLDARSALDNMGYADQRTFNQYVDDEPLKRALATHLARATRDALTVDISRLLGAVPRGSSRLRDRHGEHCRHVGHHEVRSPLLRCSQAPS